MISIPSEATKSERAYIEATLKAFGNPPSLEGVWSAMDAVWREYGCNNQAPDSACLDRYYRHPVWLLNGLFIEQDSESMRVRRNLARYVTSARMHRILDFGGGFGTLARALAEVNAGAEIDVFEPHAHPCAVAANHNLSNVRFVSEDKGTYDAVVALDVLEHVVDPIACVDQCSRHLAIEGLFLAGNCFRPVIQCHLPCTFHFRWTFRFFMSQMGFKYIGRCEYVEVYRKVRASTATKRLRRLEAISRWLFACLSPIVDILSFAKKRIVGKLVRYAHT